MGGAGGQSKCEGDERGFTILTNVTDAKFRVCDPSRLSRSRRFQRWRVFAFRVVKMLSRRGRKDAKTFVSAQLWQNLSWSELFRLDSKLGLHSKSGKKLTEWLQKNLEKIKRNPIKIEAGKDNKSNKLHSSRFIGGHICQNSDIWLQACESIGITGLDPISRYNADGVGLTGHINSHIWALLHNPGNKDISITR